MKTKKKTSAKTPVPTAKPARKTKKHGTKAQRKARSRAANVKGDRLEVEVAHLVEHIYPAARRGKDQGREGHDAPDVVGTPWWFETKNYKGAYPARAALMQALEATTKNSGATMRPVAVIRQSFKRPDLSVMRLEDWIELVSRAETAEAKVRTLEEQVAELEVQLALKGLDDP